MINEITEAILLAHNDPAQLSRIASLSQSIPKLSNDEVDELLDRLLDFGDELRTARDEPVTQNETHGNADRVYFDQLLQPVIHQLVEREQKLENEEDRIWANARFASIQTLYRFAPAQSDMRNHLLRWLAVQGQEEAIQIWTDLVCDDPPEHRLGIVLAFAPLMQAGFGPPEWIFSQLLNHATRHSQIAPAVFDLFNYYFRNERIEIHPAQERVDALTGLLGQVSGQLGQIEEGNFPSNFDANQINQLVSDSVALIVALCDTFAQLEHHPAIPKLHQALSLRHRRVQTESAAALARLGDEMGKHALIELADQPVARLRALAYAEELGFKDEISLELQGEIALAESHLAIWLSESQQMGLAPSNIEFIENREMYWPSYEHPVQCYLFKYLYGSGEQSHSNIGICGPMTHAFAADIQHLEPESIYAAFAGWQTVHNEIFQISLSRAQQAFPNQWRRLTGDLHAEGFDSVEPHTAASFFGEIILISEATKDGEFGTAIVDGQKVTWYAHGNPDAPIDWQMAYAIWRGHQMLTSFNESESA
ncbi:MAG: hypothetical protein P8J27_08265 [Mariniblastus sp.]|nr:hypothetical protein [Mariniblastus sp.]